ncbi:pyridoxine 5'-phosphate synthase [Flammeovirga kamogawensis]|uniref:Pyridoxine 5'-phosphate synthase n=1 Tax=Flammeovirga kamogawensis TaxID=373891 RepID=A0ABX8GU36_9BACT|nr:pyridoxine 5'-phosphate synthase [Flammeovirga kamogawensis]MBB6459841.1 pyridoxine 5-phosphate synthase [Flammeovirga kamogawensis]QWG07105.1 pyridoxine 5'-phosphate synthase [Flammeovirga kamogawensis]TRX68926.1 pyridoxine 5'-phosphate synthase [Flammeovirga kamogawensis]
MTRLSVNINKIATIRNARGANNPNLVQVAKDCERFGAQGITIHPRPDERHITNQDTLDLKPVVTTEYNIEGNPAPRFIELVKSVTPEQATLVPDADDAITSNAGWDTIKHKDFLTKVIKELKADGIRVSIFVDPDPKMVEGAAAVGADRVELYTEPYAANYSIDREKAIAPYITAAAKAKELGLGLNAGHDLDLENLAYFHQNIKGLDEVSIGHALVCDALYFGLENTIQMYLKQLS